MAPSEDAEICIALIGNPNTGKSTLFGALAGVRQRVGNYPGVTVEKKIGHMTHGGRRFALLDLPGTYSLAPRSPDEMLAVDVLLGRRADTPRPDVALAIVDASNLQRNMYLLSQVLELGLPTVLALNMTDVARSRGMTIDAARLSKQLGIPVVEVQANRRQGIAELTAALAAASAQQRGPIESPFPQPFQDEVEDLTRSLAAAREPLPRYLVERLLLDTTGYLEAEVLRQEDTGLRAALLRARDRLANAGCEVPAIEAVSRYGWVHRTLDGVVTRPTERPVTLGDRADRLLTHRLWGSLFFLLLMVVVFQAVFSWAAYPMEWTDAGVGLLGDTVGGLLPEGALRSLVIDGVIGGVGGVLVFLPQILILFFFIAVLEDCGYMARAAYLMDRLMVRVGLSGKSFIPLLSSFACAIPGVMATRTIENRRDRLTTILIAPLMSCSARLPVYAVLIAAFIPETRYLGGLLKLQGLTLLAMYLVGIVTAVFVALILKRTILRGPTPPFVMELPSYKLPSPGVVTHRILERAWSFIYRAGTLIVAVSIVVWASLYYPHGPEVAEQFAPLRATLEAQLEATPANDANGPARAAIEAQLAEIDHLQEGAYQRQSILGRIGHWLEPAVRPLGWDWRIGCAAIASFPAREVIVATLGIIYNLGEIDAGEAVDSDLPEALRRATWDDTGEPVFNIPVALSIMVFFALCAQCAATLVVIKRETDSWLWPMFSFLYMTTLAYLGALLTYQVGMWIA
ncbi:MAG TPA: ferrous iron transport protein B [Pirellulales bacterium]